MSDSPKGWDEADAARELLRVGKTVSVPAAKATRQPKSANGSAPRATDAVQTPLRAARERYDQAVADGSAAEIDAALAELHVAQRRAKPPEQIDGNVIAVGIHDFLAIEFPPREYLLSPIIPRQGLIMIHGPRGLGKTQMSLNIAHAIASGGSFLRWSAPSPNGVLFIDGEMPAVVLQERLSRIAHASASEATATFRLITPDLNTKTGLPNLSGHQGQLAIDAHVDQSIGLIVLDNLSSLVRSGVENDAESWTVMQTWALRHRAVGRSVLFIHHSGKGGAQRGTSRREDVLDTVIGLRKPPDYSPQQGARFEVHVEKARGFYGDDAKSFDAQLTTDEQGAMVWTMTDLEGRTEDRIIELAEDGMKPNDIAAELNCGRATVYRHLRRAGLIKGVRS
jgi:DNA-binding CsgD family transcriptional regulator